MAQSFSIQEHKQWLISQPKKLLVSRIIFSSDKGNILIVKPNYTKNWQLPGGVVDAGESPDTAVVRETFEELGLKISIKDIEIIDTIYKQDDETLIFIYKYSKLLKEDIFIKLQTEELTNYKFISPHNTAGLLSQAYTDFWVSHYSQ